MRISDWSSDVCSSDLVNHAFIAIPQHYMSDGRRSLFIQSDTFLIIEADVIECGAAPAHADIDMPLARRSEEHTSELQSLMRISYAVFCLKKKNNTLRINTNITKHIQTTTKHQYNTHMS